MTATLELDIYPVNGRAVWHLFAPHHYLTQSYAGHRAFLAVTEDGEPVAFASSISFPHKHIKNARRSHRTVVLPDYQGLGLGGRLSDWLGAWHLAQGHRFYSRTTHPRMGAYRDASPLWRATAGSGKRQTPSHFKKAPRGATHGGEWHVDLSRIAYSHEYVGQNLDSAVA
jgi:GNAT superfamily N-acetyltransferase